MGFEDAIVIHTRGDQLVVVQRDDLNNRARQLAYYDNRVGQVNLLFDAEQLLVDMEAGFDFGDLYDGEELARLLRGLQVPESADDDTLADILDRSEELNEKWQVQIGDRWHIPNCDRVGDPAYLKIIQGCIEQPCKLLGLNQPERIADPDGRALGSSFADQIVGVFQTINQAKTGNNVISLPLPTKLTDQQWLAMRTANPTATLTADSMNTSSNSDGSASRCSSRSLVCGNNRT